MAIEILLPKLGLTMEEAELISWFKKVGEPVQKGEIILNVETDKAVLDVESPTDGILQEIVVHAGEAVAVGGILGYLGSGHKADAGELAPKKASLAGASALSSSVPKATIEVDTVYCSIDQEDRTGSGSGRVRISPAARKIAREKGLRLEEIKGTGPGGRIVLLDVIRTQNNGQASLRNEISGLHNQHGTQGTSRQIPLTRMRKQIAERMTRSFMTIPQFQIKKYANVTNIENIRNTLVASLEKSTGYRLSLNDFLIQAVALTLRKFSRVNASYIDQGQAPYIVEHEDVNVGLAVSIDGGLVVPVIHRADTLSLVEICKQRAELTAKAKNGELKPDELSGGTFTISNLASLQIDEFVAIVNPPETGILAVGQARQTPVWIESQMQAVPQVSLNASFDHRTLDGAEAAKFMVELARQLESDQWKII